MLFIFHNYSISKGNINILIFMLCLVISFAFYHFLPTSDWQLFSMASIHRRRYSVFIDFSFQFYLDVFAANKILTFNASLLAVASNLINEWISQRFKKLTSLLIKIPWEKQKTCFFPLNKKIKQKQMRFSKCLLKLLKPTSESVQYVTTQQPIHSICLQHIAYNFVHFSFKPRIATRVTNH